MKKNEQALLVVLSYVIGFTTAFIMFVLVGENAKDHRYFSKESAKASVSADREDKMVGSLEIMETAEGLFIKKDGHERILSAYTESGSAGPGFHTDVAVSSISPDGQYVYYCAEMEAGTDSCQCFVYSVAEDTTYIVKDGETALQTSSAEASEFSWSDSSEIQLNGRMASQESMWVLR